MFQCYIFRDKLTARLNQIMASLKEMQKQLSALQKKVIDLQMNFARQEIEMQILKNQIKEKGKDQDGENQPTSSRQPLREISASPPRDVPQSTNSFPLAPYSSPLPSPTPVLEVESGDPSHNLNSGSTSSEAIMLSSPTFIHSLASRRRLSLGISRPRPPTSSFGAFPRLPISPRLGNSRLRHSRAPPQTPPRLSVKCPMCKKTVKKPMRLQQCPQVCIS